MYLHANAKLGLAGRLALVRAVEDVVKRSANRSFTSQSEMQNLHSAAGMEHVLEQVSEQSVRKLLGVWFVNRIHPANACAAVVWTRARDGGRPR
jgi:hypothetical protein